MDHLEKSIIIVAHPDDENLWFSSILSKVDWIVLCFLAVESKPAWTAGREKSLSEYPLDNINCLGLKESEAFWDVDWSHPTQTEYGLKITENKESGKYYRQNFEVLKNQLRDTLRGYLNVFTHNPWGEYGHVEHVQVYRAVKALQEEMGFELWFPNYVSNKSITLMAKEYSRIGSHLEPRKTNTRLAESIAEIYKRNECWTWYDDYEWCDQETFIQDIDTLDKKGKCGKLLNINMIDVGVQLPLLHESISRKLYLRIRRKLQRLLVR